MFGVSDTYTCVYTAKHMHEPIHSNIHLWDWIYVHMFALVHYSVWRFSRRPIVAIAERLFAQLLVSAKVADLASNI